MGTGFQLMLSGLSIDLLSFPLQWRADQEAERAVRWTNATLQR